MKKKIKFFLSVFVMAALAGVMWRQSHLTYQQYSRNLTQMSSEEGVAEIATEFPDTYEEEVSDQFSIRADIITGQIFNRISWLKPPLNCICRIPIHGPRQCCLSRKMRMNIRNRRL